MKTGKRAFVLQHAHASPFNRQRPACTGHVMVSLDIDAGSCFSKLELLFQSHESHVDAAEVLDSLNLVARGVITTPETIELSEAYLKNAGREAQIRANWWSGSGL